jgi:hypothetical protein
MPCADIKPPARKKPAHKCCQGCLRPACLPACLYRQQQHASGPRRSCIAPSLVLLKRVSSCQSQMHPRLHRWRYLQRNPYTDLPCSALRVATVCKLQHSPCHPQMHPSLQPHPCAISRQISDAAHCELPVCKVQHSTCRPQMHRGLHIRVISLPCSAPSVARRCKPRPSSCRPQMPSVVTC